MNQVSEATLEMVLFCVTMTKFVLNEECKRSVKLTVKLVHPSLTHQLKLPSNDSN